MIGNSVCFEKRDDISKDWSKLTKHGKATDLNFDFLDEYVMHVIFVVAVCNRDGYLRFSDATRLDWTIDEATLSSGETRFDIFGAWVGTISHFIEILRIKWDVEVHGDVIVHVVADGHHQFERLASLHRISRKMHSCEHFFEDRHLQSEPKSPAMSMNTCRKLVEKNILERGPREWRSLWWARWRWPRSCKSLSCLPFAHSNLRRRSHWKTQHSFTFCSHVANRSTDINRNLSHATIKHQLDMHKNNLMRPSEHWIKLRKYLKTNSLLWLCPKRHRTRWVQ